MAKVFGPALGLAASGSVGKAISFQERKSGSSLIKKPRHNQIPNTAQTLTRGYYKDAVEYWRAMEVWEKDKWNDYIY